MSKHDEEQFQAEQDVRTMVDAEKIKKDPKRLGRTMKEAKKQAAALAKVQK